MPDMEQPTLRIFYNTNTTMSRGKLAAHAVHAALKAFGVHPGIPVVVLGGKPRDIEKMRSHIHDAGHTELEPGTLTCGTDYVPGDVDLTGLSDQELAARLGALEEQSTLVMAELSRRLREET